MKKLKYISFIYELLRKFTKKKEGKNKGNISIKVIGIGCGGCNIIDSLSDLLDTRITLIACDTDKHVIERSKAKVKIKIGNSDLGCGNNPEKGIQEIKKDLYKITNEFKTKTDIVFCIACLGGGFSNGATPIIINELKNLGIQIISIVTFPFLFEGEKKILNSSDIAAYIKEKSKFLFAFRNENLLENNKELPLIDSLKKTNKFISEYVANLIKQCENHNSLNRLNP